jgi:hypothetical protein
MVIPPMIIFFGIRVYGELCLLYTTALTMDNILKELKQVEWKTLKKLLLLPPSQWRKIERKYAGKTERKREGVKHWLWNCPYASWRILIVQLDEWDEYAVADQIREYAEKLTGMWGSSLY